MNNKGHMGFLIFFFIIIAVVLTLGLILVIGSSLINYTLDIIAPEIAGIGNIGSANFTEIASYSVDPLNEIIQNFTWFTGVIYMLALISLFGLSIAFRMSMSKWLIPLFVVTALLIVIVSIFMSNIYQDFYEGNDEIATIMKEHTMLNYLILHSPLIFTIIIFISGVILFSGMQQEEFI